MTELSGSTSSGIRWRSMNCDNYLSKSCDCSGSNDGKAKVRGTPGITTLQRYRNQYENCTRIWGNLEITFIMDEDLEEDGANPESALDFFNTIEEVTGYVLIFATRVSRISLSRLKIIWGDTLYKEMNQPLSDQKLLSLFVFDNPKLQYIDFGSLRSIERGNIVLGHNSRLCYWKPEFNLIDFKQLLGKEEIAFGRLDNFSDDQKNNFALCNQKMPPKCDKSCVDGHCWGPAPSMCQQIYRTNCSSACESGMCFKRGNNPGYCCHKACTAGCTGEKHDQCIACKDFEQDFKCVETCNGLQKYNHATQELEPHPEPRYKYARLCVPKCPESTLIQGDHCVTRCQQGYFADTEAGKRICEKCIGPCPKRCTLKGELTAANIDSLINCTYLEGKLEILTHSFMLHHHFNESGRYAVRALTETDLEKLSSVTVVTDMLNVQVSRNSPTSLRFLRNLRVVEGRRLGRNNFAIEISSNDNLKYLGLTSLKEVRQGRVIVSKNYDLCYAKSVKWDEIIALKPSSVAGEAVYKVVDNKEDTQCERQGFVCDSKCNSTWGCWGPGDEMCLMCADWRIGPKCVNRCPSMGYFPIHESNVCLPCHSECDQCINEGPLNCTTCKNVKMYHSLDRNHFECLAVCPNTHYADGDICKPCHALCFDNGCTGPLGKPGFNGCEKCKYGELSEDCSLGKCSVLRCLPEPPANIQAQGKYHCPDVGLSNYFSTSPRQDHSVERYICQKCKDECTSCTQYGTEVVGHGCQCRNFELAPNFMSEDSQSKTVVCVRECPVNSLLMRNKSEHKWGVCEMCQTLCDSQKGCRGRTASDCDQCAQVGLANASLVQCLSTCPLNAPYQYKSFCYDYDRAALEQSRKNTKNLIVGSVIVALMLVLLMVAAIAYIFLRKYQVEAKNNAPPIPDLEPVDPRAQPNMSRLHLIGSDHLARSASRLGSGAFGVVYGGYWWPDGKTGRKVPVAIKVVHEMGGQREMLAEAGLMAGMRHEHLLRLVGVCLTDRLQLITPLRPLGNLLQFLHKHQHKLASLDLIRYCHQVSSAMEYLEQHRLVHRDLAARNVLVKTPYCVEVTDFGLAKMLEYGENEVYVEGKVAVKWLAIECLLERRFTHASDVWAFGVTMWEIVTRGNSPYMAVPLTEIKNHLLSGKRLDQPENCSQELYQLMLQCWMEKETARPSFISLTDTLSQFLKKPQLYIKDGGQSVQRIESLKQSDQRELINELLQDSDPNFEDPLHYFDGDISFSQDDSPITPMSPSKQTLLSHGVSRYQSDPLDRILASPSSSSSYKLQMDAGNYLVPNARPPIAYTPVVLRQNGRTEPVEPGEYYNELNGNGSELRTLTSVENKEYMTGDMEPVVVQSETTV